MVRKKNIPPEIQKIIDRYIKILKKDNLPIQQVILYGSYAKNKQHKDSDIDICVISPKFKDDLSAMQYLLKKTDAVDLRLEPVGFAPKYFKDENPLAYEIKRTGIKVY